MIPNWLRRNVEREKTTTADWDEITWKKFVARFPQQKMILSSLENFPAKHLKAFWGNWCVSTINCGFDNLFCSAPTKLDKLDTGAKYNQNEPLFPIIVYWSTFIRNSFKFFLLPHTKVFQLNFLFFHVEATFLSGKAKYSGWELFQTFYFAFPERFFILFFLCFNQINFLI